MVDQELDFIDETLRMPPTEGRAPVKQLDEVAVVAFAPVAAAGLNDSQSWLCLPAKNGCRIIGRRKLVYIRPRLRRIMSRLPAVQVGNARDCAGIPCPG